MNKVISVSNLIFLMLASCANSIKYEKVADKKNEIGDVNFQVNKYLTSATDADTYEICLLHQKEIKCPIRFYGQKRYLVQWKNDRTLLVEIIGGNVHKFAAPIYFMTNSSISAKIYINFNFRSEP
jgi:hypothetical protein